MNNTNYEFFIRRAWECERFQNGANTDTWDSLLYKKVNYDQSIGTASEIKNKEDFEKVFSDVKYFIDEAYNNLLKRASGINNNEALINSLLDLKSRSSKSIDPSEVFEVLSESFQLLNDYKL